MAKSQVYCRLQIMQLILHTFVGLQLLAYVEIGVGAQSEPAANRQWAFSHPVTHELHYLSTTRASNDESRGRFTFTPELTGCNVSIKIESRLEIYPHIFIDDQGALNSTSSSSRRAVFECIPAEDVRDGDGNGVLDSFYLLYDGEPIVTPMVRPPFLFFVQSRYPDEPEARFTTAPFELDIEESYGGFRERIMPTADLINELEHLDKREAYGQLLQLMASYGHVAGKEVFELGELMGRTSDWDPALMDLLPTQVQLLLSGVPLRLDYATPTVGMWRLNEDRAYNETQLTYPYVFNATDFDIHDVRWSITYGEFRQLYLSTFIDGGYRLDGTTTSTLRHEFRLHLQEDLETFSIVHSSRTTSHVLIGILSFGSYLFQTTEDVPLAGAPFHASPYILNVTELYSGVRTNILPTATFIRDSDIVPNAEDKSNAYKELLEQMGALGHLPGKEVFELGALILATPSENGNPLPAFGQLPRAAQLAVTGFPSRIDYVRMVSESNETYPFRYSWASDLHVPSVYELNYNVSVGRFAVTAGLSNQWTVPTNSGNLYGNLTDIPSLTKLHYFQLHLAENEEDVHIRCWNAGTSSTQPLNTANLDPDFFFSCGLPTAGPGALFSIQQTS